MIAAMMSLGFAGEMKMPSWVNETNNCAAGLCDKPSKPYERIADVQPGTQWMDAGGYCGSWATQRSVLAKGAWLSYPNRDPATALEKNPRVGAG